MNIYLCGYHRIGCEVLKYLVGKYKFDGERSNVAVFTHKPKMSNVPSLVEVAKHYNVWYTTESVNKAQAPFEPDIIASVYYRNIIKKSVIERARIGTFNVHPSLLPRHRGCSSSLWAILMGDKVTGVTFHHIDEGIDTGNIILQATIQIIPDETQETLFEKCMTKGAEFWPYALNLVEQGFSGIPQEGRPNHNKRGVPYGGTIENFLAAHNDFGERDYRKYVDRFIRAMTYPPYPYATYNGIEVKNLDEFYSPFGGGKSPPLGGGVFTVY